MEKHPFMWNSCEFNFSALPWVIKTISLHLKYGHGGMFLYLWDFNPEMQDRCHLAFLVLPWQCWRHAGHTERQRSEVYSCGKIMQVEADSVTLM